MSRPRRVIGYARVSSQEQAQGSSLQDQQNAITAYAKSRGLTVAKFYVEAESGIREKQERRTQMLALHRDVREGDLVLCAKLDRWSRDTEHTLKTIRELLEKGASFYAIDDACDPSTRDGHMMMTMRAMMAREEHARIKERMVGTRKLLRNAGYFVEGLPPLGYARPLVKGQARNVLAVDPDGAAVVRRAFALCIRGKSINDIAAALQVKRDRVHDMLRNRLYLGEIENSQGVPIRGKHEPIVDAATFAKARAAIAGRTLAGRKPRGDSETKGWILRDIARCARCGAKMAGAYAGDHETGRRHYYRCRAKCTSQYVRVETVETDAVPMIFERLAELREVIAKGTEVRVEVPAVDHGARLEKIARRRLKVLEEYEDEHITRDDLRAKLAKIDAERGRVESERDEAAAPSPLADKTVRREMIRSLDALASARRKASPEVLRGIATQLASAAQMATGAPLRLVWRTAEELAAHLPE